MITTVLFQEELQPGFTLGDYLLYERIGFGGEGLIFSAWDKLREQVVAVKFYSKRDEQGSAVDVSTEIAMFSKLEHPNIREIYHVGESEEFFYSVMRYFPFGSLSEKIFKKDLNISEALFIGVQLASTLDFLQDNLIVHRDMKPTNILLDIERRAYLTDFGLAKPISQTTQAMHTGHGTPLYAAPEQHTLQKITYKSDIYSFGIMLYEMLCGVLPWNGSVSLAIMQLDNQEKIPDPKEVNPLLPTNLVKVLRGMTSLEPEHRPPSADAAFEQILKSFEDDGKRLPPKMRAPRVFSDPKVVDQKEAVHLLKTKISAWNTQTEEINISFSHFAFLHAVFAKEVHGFELDLPEIKYLLQAAMVNNTEIDHWWNLLDDTSDKIEVCQRVIANQSEEAVKYAINKMLSSFSEEELGALDSSMITPRLINVADDSPSISFKKVVFDLLLAATPQAPRWHKESFPAEEEIKLANMVLFDSAVSHEAARLIGHIKSETALTTLLRGNEIHATPPMSALTKIWEAAGGLPRGISLVKKLQIGLELGSRQLLHHRGELVKTYLWAALAGVLGIGLQVFISLRLPTFLSSTRILNSLANGLLFGPVLGLGIFFARWIPQRLKMLSLPIRVAVGTLIGGGVTSLALMLLHIFFLNAVPTGPLITLGALLLAFGFSLTSSKPFPTWLRAIGSGLSTAAALTTTWIISLNTFDTPMLYYQEGQTVQTSILISVFSLVLGAISNSDISREKQNEVSDDEKISS
ncbi:MAG: bifunctional serine/threonine protein kinase/MFS transporter [Chloroflexota bacterium]